MKKIFFYWIGLYQLNKFHKPHYLDVQTLVLSVTIEIVLESMISCVGFK